MFVCACGGGTTVVAVADGGNGSVLDFVAGVATIVGGVVAAAVIVGALLGLGRRWLGNRWDHYRRLRRLGVNAQLDFFSSVLGQPPAIRRSLTATVDALAPDGDNLVARDETFQECIYVHPYYFVDALIDDEQTVVAFAVTTRTKRFRPTLTSAPKESHPRLVVRLGATRFADTAVNPERLVASLGARRFFYSEVYYLGNPGHYLSFACGVSDAGHFAWDRVRVPLDTEAGEYDFDHRINCAQDDTTLEQPLIRSFRGRAVINTWAVIGGPFSPLHDANPVKIIFGPDHDHVRTVAL